MDLKLLDVTTALGRGLDESFVHRLGLFVSAVEVTQAVQYLDAAEHLTDPADRRPDNAVRLVADKPAWVRVYVGSLFGGSGLTGTLTVQRRVLGFLWTDVATLAPHASSATSVPSLFSTSYAATRGSIGATVNFVLPAGLMIGTLRLVATVARGGATATRTTDVAVTLRQTLRLAGVMVAYDGPASSAAGAPNLTLAAPALADLQAMSGTALTLFPVRSTADFRVAGSLTQTVPLQSATFPTSGCGAAWDALHARVAGVRTADGNRAGWIYYGLLPTGTPMGPVGGCGGGGVAVGPVGQPWTLAHEAGHAAGLAHAPSGGAPNPDPLYPAYEPYDAAGTPQGHTGEYGLDVGSGAVMSPQTCYDLMGYAWPKWISPNHYGKLTDNAVLNPATVGIDHPWWRDLVLEELRLRRIPLPDPPPLERLEVAVNPPTDRQDVVSLIVRVDEGRVLDDVRVARVSAHTGLPAAGTTPFVAVLRDAQGMVLASGDLLRLTTAACGCGGGGRGDGPPPTRYVAQAFLPDVAPGSTLEILRDGEAVWRREAPAEPPTVRTRRAEVDDEGRVRLRWAASDGVVEHWVRWSADGETWLSLETELVEPGVDLAPGRVPSGRGLLQVVVHDGFGSTASEPVEVDVPRRPPDLAVLHPRDGFSYPADQELRLWASATGDHDPAEAVWSVDGEPVAGGLDAWVALRAGEHRVSVSVGGAEAAVTVFAEQAGGTD